MNQIDKVKLNQGIDKEQMCGIKRKEYRFGNSSELLFSFRGQIVGNNSKVVYTFFWPAVLSAIFAMVLKDVSGCQAT